LHDLRQNAMRSLGSKHLDILIEHRRVSRVPGLQARFELLRAAIG
jgi:hypothetical protein